MPHNQIKEVLSVAQITDELRVDDRDNDDTLGFNLNNQNLASKQTKVYSNMYREHPEKLVCITKQMHGMAEGQVLGMLGLCPFPVRPAWGRQSIH